MIHVQKRKALFLHIMCVYIQLVTLYFQSHTILLVQPNSRPDTRTYSDYESLNECLEGKSSFEISIKGTV
jgi:hypothetical protein